MYEEIMGLLSSSITLRIVGCLVRVSQWQYCHGRYIQLVYSKFVGSAVFLVPNVILTKGAPSPYSGSVRYVLWLTHCGNGLKLTSKSCVYSIWSYASRLWTVWILLSASMLAFSILMSDYVGTSVTNSLGITIINIWWISSDKLSFEGFFYLLEYWL